MKKLTEINVGLDLHIFKIEGKRISNNEERKAAWETHVDLITRIY